LTILSDSLKKEKVLASQRHISPKTVAPGMLHVASGMIDGIKEIIYMPALSAGRGHRGQPRLPSHGRLLLVNENRLELQDWRDTLNGAGYAVSACPSYLEAAQSLARERYDFIVVDQGGPAFPGRLVLKAVRIEGRIPVLVLARCAEMSCYLEAMQLGALDYFETPRATPGLVELLNKYFIAQNDDTSSCHANSAAA
jgi:CheY-like chemotaxis protein